MDEEKSLEEVVEESKAKAVLTAKEKVVVVKEKVADVKEKAKGFFERLLEHVLEHWIIYAVGTGAFVLGLLLG